MTLSISSQKVGEMERRHRQQQHKSASVIAEVSTNKVVQVALLTSATVGVALLASHRTATQCT